MTKLICLVQGQSQKKCSFINDKEFLKMILKRMNIYTHSLYIYMRIYIHTYIYIMSKMCNRVEPIKYYSQY